MCRRPPTSPLFPYTTLFRSGVGVAVLVESDLVERGELAVVAGHDLVGAHDVGLGREGLHVRRRALALQQDAHRLSGAKVASPGERGADEQLPVMAGVGDRDPVVLAGGPSD